MRLKWFKGRQLPDIMRQVRRELGEDAVILHTRTAQRGLSGLLGRASVEVLAAVDEPEPAGERAATGLEEPPAEPALVAAPAGAAASLGAEVADLRRLLIRVGGARALPPPVASFYSRLLDGGVDPDLAFGVLDELAAADGPPPALEALAPRVQAALESRLRVTGSSTTPRGSAVVALVGPPGAGKSLTAAKLAVRAQIATGRARLVSLDGVSLGARGWLEALGAASGVTCALAVTARQVAAVMGRRWAGLTLIDTPGLSPRDGDAVAALSELLRVAQPSEVHLVVPATCKTEDALAAVTALAPLRVSHLILTRLDEATTWGSLLTVAARSRLPLSWLSAGRDIPDDLQAATARGLVQRIVHGDPHS
jgi:flagellar biosynthesis protein FlhF